MNYSKPDLALFRKPRAKFDYITVALPPQWTHDQAPARRFESALDGRMTPPRRWRDHRDNKFTIHDPTIDDMLLVSGTLPEMPILALELALDFYLADGSNDRATLEQMHRWLVMCLTPQRAGLLKPNMRRFRYDEIDKTIRRDSLKTGITGRQGRTAYWRDGDHFIKVRCYIKTHDNKRPLALHCVRLEVSLDRGGCQEFEASHAKHIPDMLDRLRKSFFRLMSVGQGIKPRLTRCRARTPEKAQAHQEKQDQERKKAALSWRTFGALWAHKHDRETVPDAEANRLIGAALNDLQREGRRKNCHQKGGKPGDSTPSQGLSCNGSSMSRSWRYSVATLPGYPLHRRVPGRLPGSLRSPGNQETETTSDNPGSLRSPGERAN